MNDPLFMEDPMMESIEDRERRILSYNDQEERERRERYYAPIKFSNLIFSFFGSRSLR